VVAEDFFDLRESCSPLLEPCGESLVKLGPQLLRGSLIGRVTDEDVDEAKRVVAGEERFIRANEVLSGEREKTPRDPVSLGFSEQS
jgi:hypothetical protein